jgi:hypothetical protein
MEALVRWLGCDITEGEVMGWALASRWLEGTASLGRRARHHEGGGRAAWFCRGIRVMVAAVGDRGVTRDRRG